MSLQFKLQIKNLKYPTVWRRLVVPEDFTFYSFHKIIQVAFGWSDDHMFEFSPARKNSGISIGGTPYGDPGTDMQYPDEVKLGKYFKIEKEKWRYVYDFGDWWAHNLTLEKITPEKITEANVLAGKGKCPPEDCGGVRGYEFLLLKWDQCEESGVWEEDEEGRLLPRDWDVDEFDLERAREKVKKIR